MRRFFPPLMLLAMLLTACDGWVYVVPTFPAPPASLTPVIQSPTPLLLTTTSTSTPGVQTPSATIEVPTDSATPGQPETSTPSPTTTEEPVEFDVLLEVLGCKTSLDISHGMGEVTDAFITVRNQGEVQIDNLCVTLFALDEGRPHPDKTACIPALTPGYVVTLKLTVDSTYNQATPIQVEAKRGEVLLMRVGQPSCTDIGVAPPPSSTLKTPFPVGQ